MRELRNDRLKGTLERRKMRPLQGSAAIIAYDRRMRQARSRRQERTMSPAHLVHPVTLPLRSRRGARPRLRRWLERLSRVYGRAGMLELHR
jgi:hypothetical protein